MNAPQPISVDAAKAGSRRRLLVLAGGGAAAVALLFLGPKVLFPADDAAPAEPTEISLGGPTEPAAGGTSTSDDVPAVVLPVSEKNPFTPKIQTAAPSSATVVVSSATTTTLPATEQTSTSASG